MRSSFNGGDIIRIGIDIFRERIVVLDRYFDKTVAGTRRDVYRRLMKSFAVAIEVFDKGDNSSVIMKLLDHRFFFAKICQKNGYFAI